MPRRVSAGGCAASGSSSASSRLASLLATNSVAYLSISFGAMALGATSVNLNWRNPASVTEPLVADLAPKLLVASFSFRETASAIHK